MQALGFIDDAVVGDGVVSGARIQKLALGVEDAGLAELEIDGQFLCILGIVRGARGDAVE